MIIWILGTKITKAIISDLLIYFLLFLKPKTKFTMADLKKLNESIIYGDLETSVQVT